MDGERRRERDHRRQLVVLEHEVPAVANLVVEHPVAALPRVVEHDRLRHLANPVAGDVHAVDEIAVVLAHEVALVEEPDVDHGGAIDEQRARGSGADVLRVGPALGERPLRPRVHRLADEVQRAARVLNPIRMLLVDDDRAADLDRRIGDRRLVKALDRVGPPADVGIHQEHEAAR